MFFSFQVSFLSSELETDGAKVGPTVILLLFINAAQLLVTSIMHEFKSTFVIEQINLSSVHE